jgi:hypothetical protein
MDTVKAKGASLRFFVMLGFGFGLIRQIPRLRAREPIGALPDEPCLPEWPALDFSIEIGFTIV